MDDFYADADHYTYPGSFVLRNRLNLTDQAKLDRAEKLLVSARLLDVSGIPRTFDYAHFRALHFHMFQDLYDWAGCERDVGIIKGGSRFATPKFIGRQARHSLDELRNNLQALRCSFSALPAILSHFVNEMNVVHVFREGNGRHLREFVSHVLEEIGCGFAAEGLLRERWIPAVVAGFGGDERPMAELFAETLVAPAASRESMFASLSAERRRRFCQLLKCCGYPADIIQEYQDTLRCK